MFDWISTAKKPGLALVIAGGVIGWSPSYAGLFDDEEARKAILELRQRVETNRLEFDQRLQSLDQKLVEQLRRSLAEEVTPLRKGILDLQNQIDLLKAEIATLRGQNEQMGREHQGLVRHLSELQRQQRDA